MHSNRTEYSEKRDYIRLSVDCDVYYAKDGGKERCGQGRDLSAGGLMFEVEEEYPVGTKLQVRIQPRNNLTPPLETTVEVLRIEGSGPGRFIAGCQMVR